MSFVFYLVILLVVLAGGIIFFNILYMRTPRYLNEYNAVKKFIDGVPDNLDIMNTGSNHARNAIDWSLVGVNGFSLASGSQSISWDYRLAKKYRHKVKKNHVILIVLIGLLFCFLEYPDDVSNRRYYHFLKPGEIPRGTFWKKIKYSIFPVLSNWKNFIYGFYRRGILFYEPAPSLAAAEMESDNRIKGWKNEFGLRDLQKRESMEHLKETIHEAALVMRRIIDESRAEGIVPVLMLPPFSAVINKKISDEFIKAVILDPVADIAPDVPFLNYMKDERFQDYRYYYNCDFMNQAGREKFMPILWQDIQSVVGGKK